MSEVWETVNSVVQEADHVSVNERELSSFADTLIAKYSASLERGASQGPMQLYINWRSCPFHYVQQPEPGELQARYIIVVDAINFCFWPTDGKRKPHRGTALSPVVRHADQEGKVHPFEYDDLAGCIKDVAESTPEQLDPSYLANISPDQLRCWFDRRWSGCTHPEGSVPATPPQLEERARLLREVGAVLQRQFGGSALEFIRGADRDAIKLMHFIAARFPGFRDHAVYRGRQVFMYKRAQILVADLWGAFGDSCGGICSFRHLEQLSMFADYRVPQVLRELNVLVYTKTLAEKVDALEELPAGGEEEVEIRALTIVACRRLRDILRERTGSAWLDIEVDWLLWQTGEERRETMKPHHRTHSIYY